MIRKIRRIKRALDMLSLVEARIYSAGKWINDCDIAKRPGDAGFRRLAENQRGTLIELFHRDERERMEPEIWSGDRIV